jgi:hypothetical protein
MFKRFSNNWQPFYAPISDAASGSGMSSEMSKDDILDYLNTDDDDKGDKKGADDDKSDDLGKDEDDDKPKPKDKAKDKDKKEKESKSDDDDDEKSEDDDDDEEIDLDELEESLEEPTEEKLELVTPVSRARILKKYPNIFKDFPYLEKAYFREQQFTEIFSHPTDAKQAYEKAQTLDQFENDILSGNTEVVLRTVKETTPKAFAKLVDNYLPTLAKVDNDAHTHVVGNVIKQTIMAMVRNGKGTGNEALTTAAQILNQFVFASNEFEPPSTLARNEKPEVEDEEKTQLRARNQALIKERFEEARGELNTRVNNSIKSVIEQNIDPKDAMSDYVKRSAIRNAMEEVESLIDKDVRFKTIVNKLWENAYKANFSRSSVDSIRSAYMSKSKTLLDSVIKKSRNEALRGIGKRVREDKDDDTKARDNKGQRRSKSDDDERPRSSKSSGNSKEIPKGMSSLEFLMQGDD